MPAPASAKKTASSAGEHEPGRYPVGNFPLADVRPDVLVALERTTRHRELGETTCFTVAVGDREAAPRGAWRYTTLPGARRGP